MVLVCGMASAAAPELVPLARGRSEEEAVEPVSVGWERSEEEAAGRSEEVLPVAPVCSVPLLPVLLVFPAFPLFDVFPVLPVLLLLSVLERELRLPVSVWLPPMRAPAGRAPSPMSPAGRRKSAPNTVEASARLSS